jgi:cyclic-di-GMP-binding protein
VTAFRADKVSVTVHATVLQGFQSKEVRVKSTAKSREYLFPMPDNSFDIVSKIDLAEVGNAIQQAMKEVTTRFDLKDSKSTIATEGNEAISLHSADEYKLKAVNDILQAKLVKRGVSLKGLTYGPLEPAAGGTVKQKITLQQGIPIEKAKEIVALVKNSKKKAQASIQADVVRVSGKDRDTLQEIIAMVKQRDFGIDLQFTNYRSN